MSDTIDPDDEFLRITQDLQLVEPASSGLNVQELSDVELADQRARIKMKLLEMGELKNLNATGQAGALHSRYAALHYEQRRRSREH